MCQSCRAIAPTRKILFFQHIGAVVLMFNKHIRAELCRKCIDHFFKQYTLTTLLLGWWGVISFFLTPCFLVNNTVRYLCTRDLAR